MPLYEYECGDCGAVTEVLRKMADAGKPLDCEFCGSVKLTRKHSVFTTGAPSEPMGYMPPRGDVGTCGHCGGVPGSCQLQ